MRRGDPTHIYVLLFGALGVVGCGGCGTSSLLEVFLNQTATFGPSGSDALAGAPLTSGNRGTIEVVIENNTPYRALLTFGTHDTTDELSTPAFFQLSPNAFFVPPNGASTLEGFSSSGVVDLPCGRVFSVGGRSLINLIEANPGPQADEIDAAATLAGVGFASADLGETGESTPNEGSAAAFEALLGVDFNCGSLLHVTLEFNDFGADTFRVQMQVLPSR